MASNSTKLNIGEYGSEILNKLSKLYEKMNKQLEEHNSVSFEDFLAFYSAVAELENAISFLNSHSQSLKDEIYFSNPATHSEASLIGKLYLSKIRLFHLNLFLNIYKNFLPKLESIPYENIGEWGKCL